MTLSRRAWATACALLVLSAIARVADAQTVTTVLGTGVAGYSDSQVNNPYGIIFGPDGALYFCDLDNQRIRRFDPKTKAVATVAGNGQKGYSGDGGAAPSWACSSCQSRYPSTKAVTWRARASGRL